MVFGLFRRKKDPENEPPPPALDDMHTFEAPEGGYPASTWTWAPRIGVELPTIKNQDKILTHQDRPPGDENPAVFWEDKNSDARFRSKAEHPQPDEWQTPSPRTERAPDPRWNPPPVSRVTTTQSPSNYRFTRPFDRHSARKLNGIHFSMASNRRSYSTGGMNPVKRGRNTYRIEPTNRDAESMDLASPEMPAADPGIYISPTNKVVGRAYRLGG